MTELAITAAFVLIPLLLLIPLLGKYIDIQHATIEAARYEAWEYTVWYASNNERPTGFTGAQPVKGTVQTQREALKRFFTSTDRPIDSVADTGATIGPAERNPLWTDHRGDPLWAGATGNTTELTSSDDTPDLTGGVMNAVLGAIDTVFSAIGEIFAAVAAAFGGSSNVSFDVINIEGLAHATVDIPVATPTGLIDVRTLQGDTGGDTNVDIGTLRFSAQAAVLTDAWNAGGTAHVQDRTGGIIPTRLLDVLIDSIPGLSTVRAIIGVLIPEILDCSQGWHPLDNNADGWLWLGYVNADAVPSDRLEGLDGTVSCPNGLCSFADDPGRAPCSP